MGIGRLMTMEERIVLDAVVAVDAPDNAEAEAGGGGEDLGATGVKEAAPSTTTPVENGTTAEAKVGTTVNSIDAEKDNAAEKNVAESGGSAEESLRAILVNKDLQDFNTLVAATTEDVMVFSYDNNTADLQEIIDGLKEQAEGQLYDSIAIATEGNGEGGFALTASENVAWDTFGTEAEQDQQEFFEALAGMVEADGQIDILSCNTAAGEHGQELLESIAGVTGLDVAGSTDLTGNETLGGDWVLEESTGGNKVELEERYFDKSIRSEYYGVLADNPFTGGIGFADNPWQISTIEQLQAISSKTCYMDDYYVIVNDIDASVTKNWNQDTGDADGDNNTTEYLGFAPINIKTGENSFEPFSGSINGLGHVIFNLYINRDAEDDVGLIGTNLGIIQNLGVVGDDNHSTIDISGKIFAGGLVAYNYNNGVIKNCYTNIDVKAGNITNTAVYVGGLVGKNQGRVENSYSFGTVKSDNTVSADIGGLIGANDGNTAFVIKSFSSGETVYSGNSSLSSIGGLAGSNDGNAIISKSFAKGAITKGVAVAGGLVGYNQGNIEGVSTSDPNTTGIANAVGTNVGGSQATSAALNLYFDYLDWDSNVWDNLTEGQNPTLKKTEHVVVNHAPSLYTLAKNQLNEQMISETNPDGTSVGDFIYDSAIGDQDFLNQDNVPEAIVVTEVDNTYGYWEYSIDNGNTWSKFTNTVGSTVELGVNSRLLDSNDIVRFKRINGIAPFTPTIKFRAWDKTTGSSGETADPSSNGGSTAFSSGVGKATVAIVDALNVNNAPTADNIGNQAFDNSGEYSLDVSGYFHDSDRLTYLYKRIDPVSGDAMGNADWLTIDANTGVLSGNPSRSDEGTMRIKVMATDTAGQTAQSNYFNIEFGSHMNDVPNGLKNGSVSVRTSSGEQTVATLTPCDYDVGDEHTQFTYTLLDNADKFKIEGRSLVMLGGVSVGSYDVSIRITDPNGADVNDTINVKVQNRSVHIPAVPKGELSWWQWDSYGERSLFSWTSAMAQGDYEAAATPSSFSNTIGKFLANAYLNNNLEIIEHYANDDIKVDYINNPNDPKGGSYINSNNEFEISSYYDAHWENEIGDDSSFNTVYLPTELDPNGDVFEVVSVIDDINTPVFRTKNKNAYYFSYDAYGGDWLERNPITIKQWVDHLEAAKNKYKPIERLTIVAHGKDTAEITLSNGVKISLDNISDKNSTVYKQLSRLKSDGIIADNCTILLESCLIANKSQSGIYEADVSSNGVNLLKNLLEVTGAKQVFANSGYTGPDGTGPDGSRSQDWDLDFEMIRNDNNSNHRFTLKLHTNYGNQDVKKEYSIQ